MDSNVWTVRGVIFCLLISIFGLLYFVWPTPYRWDHAGLGEGSSIPMRINRFTGDTYIFAGYSWVYRGKITKTLKDIEMESPLPNDLVDKEGKPWEIFQKTKSGK